MAPALSEAQFIEALVPEAASALNDVIRILEERQPLSAEQRREQYDPYARERSRRILESGMTYGEATGAPGLAINTRDEAEFKAYLRAIDNDVTAQTEMVGKVVDHYFKHGEVPPLYYAWRIAVILRKYKAYDLEARFLESFAKHFGPECGTRYSAISKRASKARQFASKHVPNRSTGAI